MDRTGVLIVVALLSPMLSLPAHAGDRQTLLRQEIAAVRSKRQVSTARTEAAERIERLTRKMRPAEIDDSTLSDLVSLLEIQDDSIRAWVSASIGNLGPRAKPAVPELLKVLAGVECTPLVAGMTSESFIRTALKRIGAEAPPAKCNQTHPDS
jgi:hypothetical protein